MSGAATARVRTWILHTTILHVHVIGIDILAAGSVDKLPSYAAMTTHRLAIAQLLIEVSLCTAILVVATRDAFLVWVSTVNFAVDTYSQRSAVEFNVAAVACVHRPDCTWYSKVTLLTCICGHNNFSINQCSRNLNIRSPLAKFLPVVRANAWEYVEYIKDENSTKITKIILRLLFIRIKVIAQILTV